MPLKPHPHLPLTRRTVLGGLGGGLVGRGLGIALTAPLIRPAAAQAATPALALRLTPASLPLRAGAPPSSVARAEPATAAPRLRRGDTVALTIINALTSPAVLTWRGIDGAAPAQPIPAGGDTSYRLPLGQAGTLFGEVTLTDGSLPARAVALVVEETAPPETDGDETLLIEEWQVHGDGRAVAAGQDSGDAATVFTVNGKPTLDISSAPNSRLRSRLINGSQRSVIALRIPNYDIHVIAIDSRPAEPFIARNSQLVLAPGSRIDAIIDVTGSPGSTAPILLHDGRDMRRIGTVACTDQPASRATPLPAPTSLPTEGLPEKLDLARAVRAELPLAGTPWSPLASLDTARPAIRAKRGQTVTLAIRNTGQQPLVVRLHGHHARLLDRLDDGWKPYWVDTLPVGPGVTERLAFLAEFSGRHLLEMAGLSWDAPRLAASYVIE